MRFLNRGWWPTLQLVYRFPTPKLGEEPTNEIAGGPVQLVHDVSRESELGAALAGIGNGSIVNTHAAADTQTGTFVIATANIWARIGVDVDVSWLWLKEATVRANTTNCLSVATLCCEQVDDKGRFQDHIRLLARWNAVAADPMDSGAGTFPGLNRETTLLHPPAVVPMPALIPPNSTLTFRSISTAAAIIRVDMQFQAMPIGVGPFGMR